MKKGLAAFFILLFFLVSSVGAEELQVEWKRYEAKGVSFELPADEQVQIQEEEMNVLFIYQTLDKNLLIHILDCQESGLENEVWAIKNLMTNFIENDFTGESFEEKEIFDKSDENRYHLGKIIQDESESAIEANVIYENGKLIFIYASSGDKYESASFKECQATAQHIMDSIEMDQKTIEETDTDLPDETEAIQGKDYLISNTMFKWYTAWEKYNLYSIVVEITNISDQNLYLKDIELGFMDDAGIPVLSTEDIWTGRSILRPGEKGYFYNDFGMLSDDLDGVNEIYFYPDPHIEKTTLEPVEYDLTDLTLTTDEVGNVCVKGKVNNNSSDDLEEVKLRAVFYDKDGKISGMGSCNLTNVPANSQEDIEVAGWLYDNQFIPEDQADSFEVFPEGPYFEDENVENENRSEQIMENNTNMMDLPIPRHIQANLIVNQEDILEYDEKGEFTMDDWVDAFDSICVYLECSVCHTQNEGLAFECA